MCVRVYVESETRRRRFNVLNAGGGDRINILPLRCSVKVFQEEMEVVRCPHYRCDAFSRFEGDAMRCCEGLSRKIHRIVVSSIQNADSGLSGNNLLLLFCFESGC